MTKVKKKATTTTSILGPVNRQVSGRRYGVGRLIADQRGSEIPLQQEQALHG